MDTTDQSVIQIFKSKLLTSQTSTRPIGNLKKQVTILTHSKGKCLNCYQCNVVKLQNVYKVQKISPGPFDLWKFEKNQNFDTFNWEI